MCVRALPLVLHGSSVTVEVLVVILGSLFWVAIGFGVGYEHGFKDGHRECLTTLRDRLTNIENGVGRALTLALKCPVCGAGRSNTEIQQGWCANCGVYSDGTP